MAAGPEKNTVYRISADSLKRSKEVMLTVLPLVEDGEEGPIDSCRLPLCQGQRQKRGKNSGLLLLETGQARRTPASQTVLRVSFPISGQGSGPDFTGKAL